MKDYRLFRKPELRYILRGWAGVSQQTVAEITEFCEKEGINTSKWTVSPEEWSDEQQRIQLVKHENTLAITKLFTAKKHDLNHEWVAIVGLVIILLGTIYLLIKEGLGSFESKIGLLISPFLAFAIFSLYRQLSIKNKEKDIQKTLYLKRSKASLEIEHQQVLTAEIKRINYYWKTGAEAGEYPNVTLDVVLENEEVVRIDEDGNYKELFLIGDSIQEFTGLSMNLRQKEPPTDFLHAL